VIAKDCDVVLIAGLPGCGKTICSEEFRRKGWTVFDDFKACAIENSSTFNMSRHFESLIASLQKGSKCAITDIDFCSTESRSEAESSLHSNVTGIKLGWIFFANDARACETNIRRRNRSSLEEDLRCLRRYAALYSIPEHADVRRIRVSKMVKPKKGSCD
jgi:hypothetical protein